MSETVNYKWTVRLTTEDDEATVTAAYLQQEGAAILFKTADGAVTYAVHIACFVDATRTSQE